MRRILLTLCVILGILAAACMPGRNVIRITPVTDTLGSPAEMVYALPRTGFEVKVYFELVRRIKGPYAGYADKFLGITRVVNRNERWWQISDMEIRSFTETDPRELFAVQSIQGNIGGERFTALCEQGLILDPAKDVWIEADMDQPAPDDLVDPAWFTDLSVKPNIVEKTDTFYKTILTDSSFIRIPVLTKQAIAKTAGEKAEEAASFLMELRSRRFDLISGEYDIYPEGTALETALKEFYALEQEYLSLFTGKTVKDRYVRSFIVIPEVEGSTDLAWFSMAGGMMDRRTSEAERLQFRIQVEDPLPVIEQPVKKDNILFYRMPVPVTVQVNLGTEVRAVARTKVYQLGPVVPYRIRQVE